MGSESDRSALLDWEEVSAVEQPSLATEVAEIHPQATTVSSRALGGIAPGGGGWSSSPQEITASFEEASPAVPMEKGTNERVNRRALGQQKIVTSRREADWNRRDQDQVLAVFVVTFDTRSGACVFDKRIRQSAFNSFSNH